MSCVYAHELKRNNCVLWCDNAVLKVWLALGPKTTWLGIIVRVKMITCKSRYIYILNEKNSRERVHFQTTGPRSSGLLCLRY